MPTAPLRQVLEIPMNEAQLTVALAQVLKVIENLTIIVTEQQKSIIQLRADVETLTVLEQHSTRHLQ